MKLQLVCVAILLGSHSLIASENACGTLRMGPAISAIQPNWTLAVSVDYSIDRFAAGFAIDMLMSDRPLSLPQTDTLRLAMIGFLVESRYQLFGAESWLLDVGAAIGARSIAYQGPSNNNFSPMDWIPFVPDSPIGSVVHIVVVPFVQFGFSLASWVTVVSRVSFQGHFGDRYQDLSAQTLSGPRVEAGVRLALNL